MFKKRMLQQHLPLAVLKPIDHRSSQTPPRMLQQHLPLAVLKHNGLTAEAPAYTVATALTACGIETLQSNLC